MLEMVISLIIFCCVGVPLLVDLIQTIKGKREISKKELSISVTVAIIITIFILVRLCLGSGYKAITAFDIYFIVVAIAEFVVYKKQKRKH